MRKSLWIILAVLVVAVGAPIAHADTVTNYQITFTTGTGVAPTSGSFTYDSTNPQFSNFIVDWDGISIDLTAAANAPFLGNPPCSPDSSTPAYGFVLMSQATNCNAQAYGWFASTSGSVVSFGFQVYANDEKSDVILASYPSTSADDGAGNWKIAPTAAPEPSSIALMLLGIGLVFMVRKRQAGLSQAS